MKRSQLYLLFWLLVLQPSALSIGAAPLSESLLEYDDIFRLEEISEPRFSPNGQHIIYTRLFADSQTDRKYSNLWIVDINGKQHQPLTQGHYHDSRPRWSPDGKWILFSANRGEADHPTQLFTLNVSTRQLKQITHILNAPRAHAWSPNGQRISYVAFVPKPSPPLVELTAPLGAEWAKPPVYVDKLHYRFAGQYLPHGEDHLFVVSAAGGVPGQITPPGKHYSLSPHRATAPVWSADNQSLIFAANLHPDREFQPLESNLYQIAIGNREITPLMELEGPQHSPVVSPDGQSIAYLGYQGQGYKHVTQIYVIKKGSKQSRGLTRYLDRSARQLQWSADGQGLYFLYDDQGNTKLGYQPVQGDHSILAQDIGSAAHAYPSGAYHVSAQGDIVLTHSRPDRVGELMLITKEKVNNTTNQYDSKNRQYPLISINADILDNRVLGKVEEIRYPSSIDGLDIQGWVIKPPHFDPSKTYPLVVNIHGGPMDNFGNRFSLAMQLVAAQGNIVLYTNPRGSSSYGENFGEIIHRQAYPGKDFYDINSGVDVLLQRDYIDKDNLFVTGVSYGATMTCWIIGNTNRFRAAAALAPVTNWYSATLTTEAPVLYQQLSGYTFPWENQDSYLKRSPLSLVGNVTTPTLLITGDADYRNPISETEAYYTALKLQKVDAAMLRLPDEDHIFYRRPSNTLQAIAHSMAWFEKYRIEPRTD